MSNKTRLDVLLVERGLAVSRQKAQAIIMAGDVFVEGQRSDKPGTAVANDAAIEVRGNVMPYVSRGGWKLEKAMHTWPITLAGKICADIGASTGGFTDCMLQNGAEKVYAVDVGYGQLDWKLRNDPRVTVMERTNARYLTPEMFAERPEIAVMDVSFISIRLIIPAAFSIMGDTGRMYTLIKPQFEAGRDKIGKNGVVRNPEVHKEVLGGIVRFAEESGLHVFRMDYSPITGPEGNIEFLAEIAKGSGEEPVISGETIHAIVTEAHEKLL